MFYCLICRSSRLEVLYKNDVLKNFAKFIVKQLSRVLFFLMKLQVDGETFMISYFKEYLPTTNSDFEQILDKWDDSVDLVQN